MSRPSSRIPASSSSRIWQKLFNHMNNKVKNYAIHPTYQIDLQNVWLET